MDGKKVRVRAGILAEDIEKMVCFYKDILGLETDWDGGSYAEFFTAGGRFALFMYTGHEFAKKVREEYPARERIDRSCEIGLWLPSFADVDAEYERLSALQVPFPAGGPATCPSGVRSFHIADPEGNLLEIGSDNPGTKCAFTIIPYDDSYRDDMIFMVLQAKDALKRTPKLNPDLLDIKTAYSDRGGGFWLAIDESGRVVGCAGFSRIPGTDEAFLHRLYVKAAEKHKGIGSALLAAAEEEMLRQGISVSRVHLGEPKEQWFESYSFYPKHGYAEYEPAYMKKDLRKQNE